MFAFSFFGGANPYVLPPQHAGAGHTDWHLQKTKSKQFFPGQTTECELSRRMISIVTSKKLKANSFVFSGGGGGGGGGVGGGGGNCNSGGSKWW